MKKKPDSERYRSTALLLICAVVSGLFLLGHWGFVPLREAESLVQDWVTRLGHTAPADPRLVLIGIDKPTYDEEIMDFEAEADPVMAALRGTFPWSRVVWAALVERLAEAGARVIVIDVLFGSPDEGDEEFARVLEKHRDKVVLGCLINVEERADGTTPTSLALPYDGLLRTTEGRPVALDDRVGFANIWADEDGVLRRARYQVANYQLDHVVDADSDALIESLAARALAKLGERGRIPPDLEPLRFRYTAPPDLGYAVEPVGEVLWPSTWKANYGSGEFFRDKLVLIGPTATVHQDRHRTPFAVPTSKMLGPEIHLNIMNAALMDEFLHELPFFGEMALIAFFGALAALVCEAIRQPLGRLAALAGLSAGYLVVVQLLYDHADVVMVVVSPLLVLNVGGLGGMTFDFILERIERSKLRHTMSLYFSPRVLDAVLADPGSMEPRRAEVTLLLTDLRNSTPLAEQLGPTGMFELLNRVFEVQTEAIMSEEGNLEHFLGDQFLSYWGAPQPQPGGADRAEQAALKLIRSMEAIRDSLPPPVKMLFGYGVALHGGSVLVGNKGSSRRLDYGLVGDVVNEAARVEALTKFYGVQLIVSGETLAQLRSEGNRRLLDKVIVKGKSVPVELYELENLCTPGDYSGLCRRYGEAFAAYQAGRFEEARQGFGRLVREFKDGPSGVLADRCGHLVAEPPVQWDGVWVMTNK